LLANCNACSCRKSEKLTQQIEQLELRLEELQAPTAESNKPGESVGCHGIFRLY